MCLNFLTVEPCAIFLMTKNLAMYLYLLLVFNHFIEYFTGEAPPTDANIAPDDPGAATQYNNSTDDQN